MRIMSTNMLIEKNQLQSDRPFCHLFQVDIPSATGPYRLAAYDQDVLFHGQTYFRTALQVDTLEEPTHAALINLRVTLQNVDQEVIALMENYWPYMPDPQWTVTIWTVCVPLAYETDFLSGEVFAVQQATTDYLTAVFELVSEGLTLGMLVPKRKYTTSNGFPFLPRRN